MKNCKPIVTAILAIMLTVNVYSQSHKLPGKKINYGDNSKAGKYFDKRGFNMYVEIPK